MIKLFAHRGFAINDIKQNSIESLELAYQNNFRAIEFDIWFFPQNEKKLILKHDCPKPKEAISLPIFSDYLRFKNDLTYWLDFKNLNEKNTNQAMMLVKEQLDNFAINFRQVYFAPFITNYKIAQKVLKKIREVFGDNVQLVGVCEELNNKVEKENLKKFIDENNIKFLSIFHELIDKNFIKKFPHLELFAWTVNDKNRLETLKNMGVKNFATDKIIPF
jgi:glycerophosphoryl diester phosphodiesterase